MELYEIAVTGRKSLTLAWNEVQIMPIGDVQLGTKDVDLNRLRRQITWAKDQEDKGHPPIYFLGMGDYIDVMSPSNRAAWQGVRLYDSVREAMHEKAEELVSDFLKVVRGTEGKWLGLLEGHHYYQFEDGTTSDTRIAYALKAPFLGTCAFVRLRFSGRLSGQPAHQTATCTIWCHHGAGNGIMPHAPLNRLYHLSQYFKADVYLIGHQTKKPAVPIPQLEMTDSRDHPILFARKRYLAGTGGFSLGYRQGSTGVGTDTPRGGYVEQNMLAPVALGSILVKVRPVMASKGRPAHVDLNVEV